MRLRVVDAATGIVLQVGSSPDDLFTWTVLPDSWGRPTMFTAGEWVEMTLSFGDAIEVGRPDRSATSYWNVVPIATDGSHEIEIGGFGSMPEPDEFPSGVMSLTFDDSFASQFSIAFPAMSAVGLRGTLVPIIDRLDSPGFLTSANVQAMADAGWEISPHALTDEGHQRGLHRMTELEREAELTGLISWHNDRGYPTDTYSYPGGWYTAEAGAHAGKHFAGVRSAYGAFTETWPPTQPDRIRGLVIKTATHPDITAFRAEIARAQMHRCWTVLVFHVFSLEGGGTPYEVRADTFTAFCRELADSSVAVLPMREALAGPPKR